MRTDGRKKVKGKIIQLPEGSVTVLKESEPMMVMVKQKLLVERMNPEFWSPKWESIYATLKQCNFPVHPLGDFVSNITYGQVGHREYPPAGTKVERSNGEIILRLPNGKIVRGVAYYQARNLKRTGLDIFESEPLKRYIAEGSYNDPIRSRIRDGDLLLLRSGVGSLGRVVAVINHPLLGNISQHITRISLEGIFAEFVALFLQTRYGAKQMERQQAGVGEVEIDFDEVRSLKVPVLESTLQNFIVTEYRRMALYHDLAMAAKAANNFTQAELYLQVAEGMLESLIAQVEWLIEGKQRTVTPLIPDNAPKSLQDAFTEQYRLIGETIQRAERENWEGVEKIYGMRIYANPLIRDAIRRLLEQVEEVIAGKRKNVKPVL